MLDKTLSALDFHKVTRYLTTFASAPAGEEKIFTLKPLKDIDAINHLLNETSELKILLKTCNNFPLAGYYDITPIFDKPQEYDALYTLDEIGQVKVTIEIARRIKSVVRRYPDLASINRVVNTIASFSVLEENIDGVIDSSNQVKDSASRTLKSLRKSISLKKQRIDEKIQVFIRSNSNALQDVCVREHENRPTVAVNARQASKVSGSPRGRSDSGRTLFIEPENIKLLGDELEILRNEEQMEIYRLLGEISVQITEQKQALFAAVESLIHMDVTYAKVRFSRQFNFNAPKINQGGVIKLIEATHPLLWIADGGETPVPIDVALGESYTTLIITGPNTGGKTVALKTIGLLTLMTQAGMHIPASAQSDVAVFEDVYVDIGDEQSIEQSLSTFSSHLSNIKTILESADELSLVLLDELGGGTDPSEGEALATSILKFLTNKQVRTAVNTHISQLKNLAFSNAGFENASIEFNVETLKPTYRVLQGVPGESNALSLAKRLGLNVDVISDAERYSGKSESSDFITNLQEMKISLAEKEAQAAFAREKFFSLEEELVQKKQQLNQDITLAKASVINVQSSVSSFISTLDAKKMSRKEIVKALTDFNATLI